MIYRIKKSPCTLVKVLVFEVNYFTLKQYLK